VAIQNLNDPLRFRRLVHADSARPLPPFTYDNVRGAVFLDRDKINRGLVRKVMI
jgi:hypothetical protein